MRSLLAVLLLSAAALAQGTQADYDRSQSLGKRFGGKLPRDRISVTWSADGKHLWYPEIRGKGRFVLVDVAKGTKEIVPAEKLPKSAGLVPPSPGESDSLSLLVPPSRQGRGGQHRTPPARGGGNQQRQRH